MKQFIKCPDCDEAVLATLHHKYTHPMYYYECECMSNGNILPEHLVPLKALSIRQPWAWLIVNGYKTIENRSWNTNFRGKVLIHASQKFDKDGFAWLQDRLDTFGFSIGGIPFEPEDYERGGIVGYTEITDCVEKSDSPWFFGPSGFVLKNSGTLPFTPCKGKLSFFKPEIE